MLAIRTPSSYPSSLFLRTSHSLTRAFRFYSQDAPQRDHRASAKLFQDAENEEAELAAQAARANRLAVLESLSKNENWTGDEPIQDAVLRMLVDKYKPLRSGPIRSADEKLKQAPPKVGAQDYIDSPLPSDSDASAILEAGEVEVRTTWGPSGQPMADVPLLPSVEGHQPWHTTFRVPSHAQTSIKYGHIPPSAVTARPLPASALDDKARRKEREARKKSEHVGRLHNARESTLDYKLGLKAGKAADMAQRRRPNPVGLKGWASLVEERIEKARQEGRFNTIKGRGQPIQQYAEERNPFIAREEFLMNRIVQRQGAAPPWVEIQGELESAVNSFRDIVRQSWTRRAIRMLTLSRPVNLLTTITLSDLISLRDSEWETRERAYHNTALDEINSLVRKYNGLAPYAVRRPYYMLSVELEKAYADSGEDILRGIAERVKAQGARSDRGLGSDEGERVRMLEGGEELAPLRIRDVVRQWIAKVVGR